MSAISRSWVVAEFGNELCTLITTPLPDAAYVADSHQSEGDGVVGVRAEIDYGHSLKHVLDLGWNRSAGGMVFLDPPERSNASIALDDDEHVLAL
jgi:hypothetical protein